jgi:hypothetical protein
MVPFLFPEASNWRCESGLKARLVTPPLWVVTGGPRCSPVATSQRRAVSSKLPEASRVLSELNATAHTRSL